MLPSKLRLWFNDLVSPVSQLFVRLGVHPHTLTVAGFLISLFSANAFRVGSFRWAGFLLLLGGFFDVLDGLTARSSGKGTKFGALFDSILDRYSEVAVYVGIIAYYLKSPRVAAVVVTVLALAGSLMVSYVRARAEGLGEECKVGIMQRTERVVYLGFGSLLLGDSLFFIIILGVVAAFAHVTAVQRVYHFWKSGKRGSQTGLRSKLNRKEGAYE